MSEWRHSDYTTPKGTITVPGDYEDGRCFRCVGQWDVSHREREDICATPTPDPSSPCGACDLPAASRVHMPETMAWDHPHIPTRCQCGHSIEPVR